MRFYLSALVIIFGLLLAACNDKDNSTSPAAEPYALLVICMDSMAVDTLCITEADSGSVFPVYNGSEQIGEIEIDTWNDSIIMPDSDVWTVFCAVARKAGCYTDIKTISEFHTMEIDYVTDFETYPTGVNCGVFFEGCSTTGRYFDYFKNEELAVWAGEDSIGTITTDDEGRFETDIPAGEYTVTSWNMDMFDIEESFQLTEGYAEYIIEFYEVTDEKPNLYLYPQAPITLDVNIAFPQGGRVTVSEPQFPQQWQGIHVEPNGTIDGRYGYLFYECATPDFGQRSAGWVVPQDSLTAFFTRNLRETGFVGREITDFTDWWIPRLNTADWYAIYPQYAAQLDPVISLEFSQQPDNIQRLTYCVQPLDAPNLTLATPQIPAFDRTGFVATEWGLIRLPDARKPIASR